jgi:DNA-binding transcriptional ArsR family regulator
MSNDIQNKILERLENVDTNLKLCLNLFKLINEDKIDEKKQKLLSHGLRKQIYELCDGTLPVKQIAEKIRKDSAHVTYHLNILTSAGLLSYKMKGREKYYYKTLE